MLKSSGWNWGAICAAVVLISVCGCQTTYYAIWEKLGKEKRHLLKTQVEQARVDQQEASDEFKDALTRLKEITGFDGGELETFYENLKADYEACQERARIVENRIERVDRTASDLFAEWEETAGKEHRTGEAAKDQRVG